jgi:hypothetical protein
LGGVGGGVVIEEVEQFGEKAGWDGGGRAVAHAGGRAVAHAGGRAVAHAGGRAVAHAGGRAVAHAGQDVDVEIFSQGVQEVEGVRQVFLTRRMLCCKFRQRSWHQVHFFGTHFWNSLKFLRCIFDDSIA